MIYTNMVINHTKYDDYLDRLEDHVRELSNTKERCYKFQNGTIYTREYDRLVNPNGSNKWNGWIKAGTTYDVMVLDYDGTVVRSATFDDKDKANEYFLEVAKPMAMNLESPVWFA